MTRQKWPPTPNLTTTSDPSIPWSHDCDLQNADVEA